MDIEELSKSQLILLTILVNFVTSVATAILAVSLLDHAPPYVTQTINRVVEHSIETVAPPIVSAVAPAPSNQELVTAAIGADAARIAYIYEPSATSTTQAVAIGTFLPKSHTVVTAAQAGLPKEAKIIFAGGATLPASLSKADGSIVIYGFAESAAFPKVPSVSLVAAKDLALGQTALAVGADGSASTGIISRVSDAGIQTTLGTLGAGSAVVDLSGNLIGIAKGAAPGALVSADAIGDLLTATSSAPLTGSS
jgi:hypothetical protein